ncbi:MAG: hypothetical protein JWN23_3112 [Rhodocyclales bacterium]|nr:hypothetical protein [Rhodocyclales bacterium]
MTTTSDRNESETAKTARELSELLTQLGEARAVLAQVQQEVVEAESRLSSNQSAQLLEANEQLVLRMLGALTEAETTERALQEVSRSAELDALTELPNRALLHDRFTRAIANAKRRNSLLALLFLDLNDFKRINDSLGHAVGDEVLKLAASCLTSSVREADTVSRHGGDEFVILLTEVARAADAGLIAQKVIAALGANNRVGKHELRLTASIGISIYPDDGEDADTLIDLADAAMYRAKKQGLGSYAFHVGQPTGLPSSVAPVNALRSLPQSPQAFVFAEHERHHARLQEANEQLILAALSAQELQSAAEQAHRQQNEFLAVLAHELRNPLTPIRTAAALLGRVRTDEPLLLRLQTIIERQVVHISRLVGDLLDVSRVNTGKLRLDRQIIEIADVIEASIDACIPAIEARQQHLRVDLPTHTLQVHGDPVRLTQVVSNLFDNASKYTHSGGEISFSVKVVGDAIVMTVSDNGIGIAIEALPKVFDPFVQDAHAIGFNGVGLGIGLTVVRELVEAHDGIVVALSAGTGLGSQFVVTLPLSGASIIHE